MRAAAARRRVGRGALYTALERLEAKGCLRSTMGEALPQRGGRARRYFTVTAAGMRALRESRRVLLGLWDGLESKLETSRHRSPVRNRRASRSATAFAPCCLHRRRKILPEPEEERQWTAR